ncbi:hypothetical protein BDV19DRAFT_7952 [Aspergillus venezuelensis]
MFSLPQKYIVGGVPGGSAGVKRYSIQIYNVHHHSKTCLYKRRSSLFVLLFIALGQETYAVWAQGMRRRKTLDNRYRMST